MAAITSDIAALFALLDDARIHDLDWVSAPAFHKLRFGTLMRSLLNVVGTLDTQGAAGATALAAMLSGTSTVAINTASKSISVGAAYNGKPVTVTVKGLTAGTGQFHATSPTVLFAEVTGGNLVVSAKDAITGAAVTLASNCVFNYVIDGR